MTIVEAFNEYFAVSDEDMRGELLIRRKSWKHGRVIIPGKYDIYVTHIGKYPMMPVPVSIMPDEIMADNWEITTRQVMSFPQEKPKRTGRRKQVNV